MKQPSSWWSHKPISPELRMSSHGNFCPCNRHTHTHTAEHDHPVEDQKSPDYRVALPPYVSRQQRLGHSQSYKLVYVYHPKTLIAEASRCFEKLDPEVLHICSMGHYASLNKGGFSARLFSLFWGVPVLRGGKAIHSDPPGSKTKGGGNRKPSLVQSCVVTHGIFVQKCKAELLKAT